MALDFGAVSAKMPASELVELLNFVFTTFDDALEAFGWGLIDLDGTCHVIRCDLYSESRV